MSEEAEFRAAGFAMARLSALSTIREVVRPAHESGSAELSAFLLDAAADPFIREAVAVSSASLDALLDKLVSGVPVEPKRLRSAALSMTRYIVRMTHRPTPFGLMAGVAAARLDDEPKIRIGARHRKHARVDMAWLSAVIRPWETAPAVLEHLRVVANDLCFVRGDRLIIPYAPPGDANWGLDDRERTVRHTGAVRLALAAAGTPIRHADLVTHVREAFPGIGEAVVRRMLAGLVEHDVLLTDLRPPATAADPLDHVLQRLASVNDHPGHAALGQVRVLLDVYEATPPGKGREVLRIAAGAMRALHVTDRPVHVDLAMDADIVLPWAVAEELERAAAAAWRLVPASALEDPLAEYRTAFIERYGVGVGIPLGEVLDQSAGIGPPAHYLSGPEPARRDTGSEERDLIIGEIAQRAAAQDAREVVLDDAVIERLARHGDGRPPGFVEMCVQLLADSEEDLRTGRFGLVASPYSQRYRPGSLSGRFMRILPELGPAVAGLATELAGDGTGVVPAQLTTLLGSSRDLNVVQVPRLTDQTVRIGVFADRSRPGVLTVEDLAIAAHPDRLSVLSLRDGTEVVPELFSALNVAARVPFAARLVWEIGAARMPSWPLWSWGAAARLPRLPRVRHGRTVLIPARWRPDRRLAGSEAPFEDWRRSFEAWRRDWSVPGTVEAAVLDQRLRLDLGSELHLRVLRDELRRHPDLKLYEKPFGGEIGTGCTGGHATEVVIALRPASPRRVQAGTGPPPPVIGRNSRPVHQPGGEWLYLKVYAAARRHDEIIAHHLPLLLERAGSVADRWFFMRYHDDRPHLRLRFHGEPAALNSTLLPAVHDWAAGLAAAGTIQHIVIDAYRPEVTRYGGTLAIEAAEGLFGADSDAVIAQLGLRAKGLLDPPMELLAAANVLDLVERLHGEGWQEWILATFPKGSHHPAFQAGRRAAVRLLTAGSGRPDAAAVAGGDELAGLWLRRGMLAAPYARILSERPGTRDTAIRSVLHLHHNRLAGVDPEGEADVYAIVRGAVQAHLDRKRHESR
ncbi:lantibiotic dehydratase [Actinoallomurus bryophytorum]|uniref:Thiopeptide-type bacteriocin biosynthesis protein n=1 Tax=Actinoallomurus bryophytorum TaxID=1490222 RepID=A0A543CUG3_9ACTN|nr:lantibiotic dehydratase [Actinoallomurus bryophytorum]TQM00746.1 thiopeptide-type bacteriocin biosynthesis protein [Actinoallomurus bryophytorum]